MTTATATGKQELATGAPEKKKGEIAFKPFGEDGEITLTVATVKNFIAARTRSGALPSDSDIIKFMMLCQARQLNPWVGDAFLVGYDGKDGAVFSLITAKQALDKRAELHPQYDGIESGLILATGGGTEKREGAFHMDDETVVGAWARVSRKDVCKPYYHDVKLSVYSTGRSRWAVDPGGMIVKVAEAGALRKAFPTQIGGLYCQEEMEGKERNITPSGIKQAGADLLASMEPTPTPDPEPMEAEIVEPKGKNGEPERFKPEVVESIQFLMSKEDVTDKELTAYVVAQGFDLPKGKGWDALPMETLVKVEKGWQAIEKEIFTWRAS